MSSAPNSAEHEWHSGYECTADRSHDDIDGRRRSEPTCQFGCTAAIGGPAAYLGDGLRWLQRDWCRDRELSRFGRGPLTRVIYRVHRECVRGAGLQTVDLAGIPDCHAGSRLWSRSHHVLDRASSHRPRRKPLNYRRPIGKASLHASRRARRRDESPGDNWRRGRASAGRI